MAIDLKTCRKAKSGNTVTPKCRLSFPALFVPVPKTRSKPDGDKIYQASLVIPPDANIDMLKQDAQAAATEEFGGAIPKKLRSPFLNAADLDRDEYEDGSVVIRTNTKNRPGVVDSKARAVLDEEGRTVVGKNEDGSDIVELIEDNKCYAGRWCLATVQASGYPGIDGGIPGVKFYLQNVQLLDHDEAWSGGAARARDDFEPVEGTEGDAAAAGQSADSLFG